MDFAASIRAVFLLVLAMLLARTESIERVFEAKWVSRNSV